MDFLPKPTGLTNEVPQFEPCQIVCLEHEASRLYGEVVQVAEWRRVCWVRPLMLTVTALASGDFGEPESVMYDLRDGADLLLPIALFRMALDVEVLPLYAQLCDMNEVSLLPLQSGHQQLRQLIQKVWKANPTQFQNQFRPE